MENLLEDRPIKVRIQKQDSNEDQPIKVRIRKNQNWNIKF